MGGTGPGPGPCWRWRRGWRREGDWIHRNGTKKGFSWEGAQSVGEAVDLSVRKSSGRKKEDGRETQVREKKGMRY